jgi:hypothetical protein
VEQKKSINSYKKPEAEKNHQMLKKPDAENIARR